MAHDVFLSFSHADERLAHEVESQLERTGVQCWSFRSDQRAGEYAVHIERAIKDCQLVVLLLTPAANTSDSIQRELALAVHYKRKIIPLRPDPNLEPAVGLGYFVNSVHNAGSIEELIRIVSDPEPGVPPPPPQPEPIPSLPPPAIPEAPTTFANMTGTWQAMNGVFYSIWQQGPVVTIEYRNGFGVQVMRGQGTLAGGQLNLMYEAIYEPPFVVCGQISCILSADGSVLTGQAIDQAVGAYPIQLRKVGWTRRRVTLPPCPQQDE